MNFRIFSRIVVWWIFVDLVIRSCWFSDNFHPDSEFIRLIRTVVPLLLSVGVAIMSYANGRMERLLKNRDGESLCFCAYSYWWAFLFSSVGIKKVRYLRKMPAQASNGQASFIFVTIRWPSVFSMRFLLRICWEHYVKCTSWFCGDCMNTLFSSRHRNFYRSNLPSSPFSALLPSLSPHFP